MPLNDTVARVDRIHSAGGCLARIVYTAFAGLFLLLCLVAYFGQPIAMWLIGVAAAVTAAVVTVRHLAGWAVGAAGLSALSTLFIALADPPIGAASIAAEIGGLLVLVVRVVWRVPRPPLVPVAAALALALLAQPLRSSALAAVLFTAPLGVMVAIAIGAGLYLRAVDARRARSLAAARRDERLELARDLHDFVAHHVTGIVVQAQAARFAAGSGAAQSPEQLDTMFAGIERAGGEALTSMRRMVGLLRDAQDSAADGDAGRGAPPPGGAGTGSGGTDRPAGAGQGRAGPGGSGPGGPEPGGDGPGGDGPDGDEPGGDGLDWPSRRPAGDLAQVEALVDAFGDPPATLWPAPDLGDLPPATATSVHRVVQEALTNVRKHAADATAVHVSITRAGGGAVRVAVRDDGRGRGRRLPSSGFGLAGLGERMDALGGRLHAGPRPDGGWEVVAVLPAP